MTNKEVNSKIIESKFSPLSRQGEKIIQRSTRQDSRGFSLIELLVTTSIFIIISVVVLVNYPEANGRIALRLLAQKMALSIREAQVYGVSVRVTESGKFPDYGMFIPIGSGDQYTLFADIDADGILDDNQSCSGEAGAAFGECVERYTITGQNRILAICYDLDPEEAMNPGQNCNTQHAKSLSALTVLFRRPNPEAMMTGSVSSESGTVDNVAEAYVVLGRTGDEPSRNKVVMITSTGQISVR